MIKSLKLLFVLLVVLVTSSFRSKLKCHILEDMVADEYFQYAVNYNQNLKDSFYVIDTGRCLNKYCSSLIKGRNVVLLSKHFKTSNKNYIYLTRCHFKNDSLIVSFFYPYQNIGINGFFIRAGNENKLMKIKVFEL